jgi:hypothetical protein
LKLLELPYHPYLEKGQNILVEYKQACAWLDSLGINFKRSRFGRYQKEISEFAKTIKSKISEEEKISAFYSFLNSYAEATELIRVKSALERIESSKYLSQLKKATAGQAFRNIANNDSSRDFFFELTLAARLINAGYSVTVNELADAVADISGAKVFFECKRITSQKMVKDRVKHASTQLKKRFLNEISDKTKGIIYLNVTELLNPNLVMVVGQDIHELKKDHSEMLTSFVKSHNRELNIDNRENILGVICEFNMYGYIKNQNPLAVINYRGIKFLQYDVTQEEENFVREFAVKISNQKLWAERAE